MSLKWVGPLEQRLRHMQRPAAFRAHHAAEAEADSDLTTGQRIAEQAAAGLGSWRFIGIQAGIMAVWVLVNTLALFQVIHFDSYPFVFLNLAMSAEAAFTGPVLLIAANVGAIRDHQQAARVERLEERIMARLDALDALTPPAELPRREPPTAPAQAPIRVATAHKAAARKKQP